MGREACPKCGTEKHQLMACPNCGFQRNRIYKHQQTSLKRSESTELPADEPKTKKPVKQIRKSLSKPNKKKKQKEGIYLISKRGVTLKGRYACTNCNKTVDNPTRYAESNKGPVILCASCKSKIRLRSFPPEKRDALDFATTGGRFEGNRSKH
jgi:DNA-directed RNA polymerase subunit RPC12/RpoP